MHEILTVQIGREANYVGTHFWNAQETYQTFGPGPPSPVNHDIHFRVGLARDGSETYLPRTLIYDLRGGFGSLAQVNALDGAASASADNASSVWGGPVAQLPSAPPPPPVSAYAQSLLTSATPVAPTPATTAYFSDFAATYFHPRSLQPLAPPHPTLTNTNSPSPSAAAAPTPQFTSFAHGAALFAARDATEGVLDADFRPWLEECDAVQAVQVAASVSDAWGGFAARYAEAVRDELPKTSVWAWALDGSGSASLALPQRRERAANRALALADLSAAASAVVPLAVPARLPPWLVVRRGVLWHEAALLGAALESATLPTRMRADCVSRVPLLRDWEATLADAGRRRVLALRCGVGEVPEGEGEEGDARVGAAAAAVEEDAEEIAGRLDESLPVDLLPALAADGKGGRGGGRKARVFARVDAFRSEAPHAERLAVFERRRGRANANAPVIECYAARPPLPQPITFPRIFAQHTGPGAGVPVHASLSAGSNVAAWLRDLAAPFGRAAAGVALPGDLPPDDKEALRAALLEAADAYVEDWESGSESEDEDG